MESLRDRYEQAKNSKPDRPSVLTNLFTFGSANTKYNRNVYEWNQACKPVVSRFEDLQVDVKLDNNELKQLQSDQVKNKQRYQSLRQELSRLNRQLVERIHANPDVRKAMLPHLEAVIKLLRMGREIAESKLDRRLAKTVTITQENTELPAEVKRNLSALTSAIREEAHVDGETIRQWMDEPTNTLPDSFNRTSPAERMTEEDVAWLTDAGNAALQSTVGLLEAWTNLQAMRAQSAIAHKAYDEQLAKLQDEFRRNLAGIDDKAAVLHESIRRMNTADNYEQLKDALLSLAGKDDTFTEENWQQFFEGKKTIEL